MAAQASLSLTWSKTPKTGFHVMRLILQSDNLTYHKDPKFKDRQVGENCMRDDKKKCGLSSNLIPVYGNGSIFRLMVWWHNRDASWKLYYFSFINKQFMVILPTPPFAMRIMSKTTLNLQLQYHWYSVVLWIFMCRLPSKFLWDLFTISQNISCFFIPHFRIDFACDVLVHAY